MTSRGARALVLLIAACGDNVPGTEVSLSAASGTRLKLHAIEFDGGGRIWTDGVTDTQLSIERCAFTQWADGVVRCSPRDYGKVYFTSPDCTGPVGEDYGPVHQTNPETLHYVIAFAEDGYAFRRYFRSTGVRIAGPLELYAPLPDGTCTRAFTVADLAYYSVSERTGDVAVVRFEDSAAPGRFATRMLVSDDGLRYPRGFVDRENGFECDLVLMRDGTMHCAPAGAVDVFEAPEFADADCTMPATSSLAPAVRMLDPNTGCATYLVRSPIAEGTTRFVRQGGRCVLGEPTGPIYRLAAVELAALPRAVAVSAKRLWHIVIGEGELATAIRTLHDVKLDIDCEFDESLHCMPIGRAAMRAGLYADACDHVNVALVPAGACEAPIDGARETNGLVRPLGGVVQAYERTLAGCVPYSVPPGLEAREANPVADRSGFMLGVPTYY